MLLRALPTPTPPHPLSSLCTLYPRAHALSGELFTRLRSITKFDENTSQLYGAMVASAFAYLHARQSERPC